MNMMQVTEEGLRSMKDFLSTYNKLSEQCFNNCIVHFNNRNLTTEEASCADVCVQKMTNMNNRATQMYLVEQPKITQKKMEEAEAKGKQIMEIMKSQGMDPESMNDMELQAAALKIRSETPGL
eukprot:TRINITY_DN43140_c0_g1_i1.p1 TRINITY_DN43140_c0_g1~~TRINITY_DN43140_c0_g1_i1.p1  ORF type:complete len:123 (-),score=13.72 TRINITY_DN43140_c0_g1_i1:433-801(-)